jgi:hypothetical protein
MVDNPDGYGYAEEGCDGCSYLDEEAFFLQRVCHAGEDSAGMHGGGFEGGVARREGADEVDEGEFALAVALGVVLGLGKRVARLCGEKGMEGGDQIPWLRTRSAVWRIGCRLWAPWRDPRSILPPCAVLRPGLLSSRESG